MKSITSYSIALIFLFTINLFAQDPIWVQTSGPKGGTPTCFARNSSNQTFAGTESQFIFKSNDNGLNWEKMLSPGFNNGVQSLLIPDGSTIYAGVSYNGIHRSTDNGLTWTDISDQSSGMANSTVSAIGMDIQGYLYAGLHGDQGIYRSMDGGTNWEHINNGLILNSSTRVEGFAFTSGGDVFVSILNSSVYRLPSSSTTWTNIGYSLPDTKMKDIIYSEGSNLLVAIQGQGIFRTSSSSGYTTWTQVNSGLKSYGTTVLKMTPNGNLICGNDYSESYISYNEGDSWAQFGVDSTNYRIVDMLSYGSENIFVGIWDDGIFHYETGLSKWSIRNNGYINSRIYDLELDKNGNIFAGTHNMIFHTNDGGNFWGHISEGIPSTYINDIAINKNDNTMFTATSWGFARSTDEGNTWATCTNGMPANATYTAAGVSSLNGYVFAARSNHGIYRSTDNGNSWTQVNLGLDTLDNEIKDIVINSHGTIFIGTSDKGIYRSGNNGNNWESCNGSGSGMLPSLETRRLAVNEKTGILYASVGFEGVYKSIDGGDSWYLVLPTSEGIVFSLTFNSKNHVFAGTSNRILRSIDAGETWHSFNDGFAAGIYHYFWTLCTDNDDYVYAGTADQGVYKTSNPTSIPNPILTSPIDSLYPAPLEINLKWDRTADASSYQIQVSTSSDFSEVIIDQSDITTETFLLSDLQHGLQYFWRVRAWNDFAVSGWSNVWTFLTIKKGPDLTYPTNDAVDLNTELNFSWSAVSDVIGYELQLSFASDFSTIEYSNNAISLTDYTVTDLTNGKTYYWRVRALLNVGPTDWSDVFTFTTIRLGPDLSYPPDNETNIAVFIDFSWRTVNNAVKYQLQVTSDPQFTTVDFNTDTISSTHYLQPLLSHDLEYYWRVRAYFNDGSSAWSEIRSFHTIKAGPSLNNPNNGATGIASTANFNWNIVASAVEYHIQVSTDVNFGSPEYDKDQIASTTYQITNLPYSSTYYWHVRALLNDGNYTDWSDIWDFRTVLGPIDLNSPGNNAANVELPVTFTWNGEPSASSYWLQISTEDDFDPIVFDESNITLTTHEVSILDFGTRYYWHVAAIDNGSAGVWSNVWYFDTETYPSTINANTTIQFPTYNEPKDYKATDYRLFGLPGNSDLSFDQIFGTGAGEQWIAYYDDYDTGNSENIFVKYLPDDGRFKFTQGNGFWIIKKGPLGVNIEVASADLNDQNLANIGLHNGWNIITNPFPFPVDWGTVRDLNGLGGLPLYAYDGSFNSTLIMQPYEGYYMDNYSNLFDIVVPYIESVGKIAVNTSEINWQLNILLNSDKFEDASTWLGISNAAKNEIDKLDYRKPKAIGQVPRVYFDRSEWGEKWGSMASDIRPQIDNKAIWDFDVDAPAGQIARLSFPDIEDIPSEYEVYLIDRNKLRSINLRLEKDYAFTPVTDHSKFAIIIGNEMAVEEELKSIIPSKFILGSNYPNPFNPQTIIPIELAEAGQLTIKIYNILGEEVRTLFHGSLETGRHQFTWNGTNQAGQRCPSGIYLYHVYGDNGIKATKRMVLMK